MKILASVRRACRKFGFDLHRYPRNDGLARLISLLGDCSDLTFVDVGASVGDFGAELRGRGYRGRISSIEPVASVVVALEARAQKDPSWEVHACAVGDSPGAKKLFISSNNAESSSLLVIGNRHLEAFAESRTVGEQWVDVRTLDDLYSDTNRYPSIALKLDVQGLEYQVLNGAMSLFEGNRVLAVQVEVSLVSLYEGGSDPLEIHTWLSSRGFELVFIKPGFSDPQWKLLQVDLFYFRYGPI